MPGQLASGRSSCNAIAHRSLPGPARSCPQCFADEKQIGCSPDQLHHDRSAVPGSDGNGSIGPSHRSVAVCWTELLHSCMVFGTRRRLKVKNLEDSKGPVGSAERPLEYIPDRQPSRQSLKARRPSPEVRNDPARPHRQCDKTARHRTAARVMLPWEIPGPISALGGDG